MKTRLGMFVVVLLAMTALIPIAAGAGPTRAMDAEISDIYLSGKMGPEGEYSIGEHTVSVNFTNNLDSLTMLENQEIFINVTSFPDESVLVDTSEIHNNIGIPASGFMIVYLVPFNFPEGEYNITVNTTIGGEDTYGYLNVSITDVVDLSIKNDFFIQDGHYQMGQSLNPRCIVDYVGNVEEWKDNVDVHLLIETVADVSVTLYDESETLMTTSGSPISPPYSFASLMFMEPWNIDTFGEMKATFSVAYDNYNETNNFDMITFFVDEPASVEGYALTPDDTPVPMVGVEVRDDQNILADVAETNETGYFSFSNLDDGDYTLVFSKRWFDGDVQDLTVETGITKMVNGTLTPLDLCGLEGYVYDPDGIPLMGAAVVAQKVGGGFESTFTNATGYYVFNELESGTYQIRATYTGYEDALVDQQLLIALEMNLVNLNMGETPFTVIFDPPNGEPGFPVGASISLTFSRPIEQSSVDPFTIMLKNTLTGSSVDVDYNFTADNKSIVITPKAVLEYSTNYSIEVTHWVRDVNGESFPEDKISYLITEEELFTVTLISKSPVEEEQNVGVDAVVRVIFSTAMNESTISELTFKLFARGNQAVSGTVYYYPSNNTAMFAPDEDLEYGMRYSVDLSDLIMAVDPAYIFYGAGWNFDTMEEVSQGEVSGKVLDHNYNPFPPSNVTVTLTMGQQVKPQVVDPDGDFNFLMLDEGVWKLTIVVSGYETYEENVSVVAGQTTAVGTIVMTQTPVEEDGDEKDKDNYLWIIIVIAVLAAIFLLFILAYAFQGRQKPVEAEEVDRRPKFGVRGREDMMYDEFYEGEFMCPRCGGVTSADDEVCPHCDAEFEEDLFECPECGAALAGDAPECPECGAAFELEEEELTEEEELFDEEYEEDITDEYEVVDEETGYEETYEEEEEETD